MSQYHVYIIYSNIFFKNGYYISMNCYILINVDKKCY